MNKGDVFYVQINPSVRWFYRVESVREKTVTLRRIVETSKREYVNRGLPFRTAKKSRKNDIENNIFDGNKMVFVKVQL
jgi:hypothetical protein